MRSPAPWSRRAFTAAALLGLLVVTGLPVAGVLLFWWGDEGWGAAWRSFGAVLAERRQWSLLLNSLTVAGATAAAAGVLGGAVGFAFVYWRVPGRRALGPALAVPFLVPPYIAAVAWIDLLGRRGWLQFAPGSSVPDSLPRFNPYSILGVIVVLAFSYYPVPALTTALAVRRLDGRMTEAAGTWAGPGRVFARITLPLILPSALAGSLFVFVLALLSFAAPSLLQARVYPVEVYSRFSAFHNFQEGAALALPLLVIGALAVGLWGWYLWPRQGRLMGGGSRPARAGSGGGARWLAAAGCWAVVAVTAGLPLAALGRRSLPLASFAAALETAGDEIVTSVALAAAAALVICGLGLALAYRGGGRNSRVLRLSFVPFFLSGPVLGVGLIKVWDHAGPAALVCDSAAIVVLALAAKYLGFGHLGLTAALADLQPRLLEAAEVSGVAWWRQLTGIIAPLLAPALVGTFGLAFVLAMGELDAVALVAPAGVTTLTVRLFTLMHYGPGQTVAALCLLDVGIILAGAGLAAAGAGWLRRRIDARG